MMDPKLKFWNPASGALGGIIFGTIAVVLVTAMNALGASPTELASVGLAITAYAVIRLALHVPKMMGK